MQITRTTAQIAVLVLRNDYPSHNYHRMSQDATVVFGPDVVIVTVPDEVVDSNAPGRSKLFPWD